MKKNRILFAEDDTFCQKSVGRFLNISGYDVSTVNTGGDALRALRSHSYDLCIIDYHLPGMDAREVVETVRKEGVNTPFIVVTGDASSDTERQARGLSPLFFFVKPFDLGDLRAVVDHAVGNASKHEHDSQQLHAVNG